MYLSSVIGKFNVNDGVFLLAALTKLAKERESRPEAAVSKNCDALCSLHDLVVGATLYALHAARPHQTTSLGDRVCVALFVYLGCLYGP